MIDLLLQTLQTLSHSPQAKVWVYKSIEPISDLIVSSIQKDLSEFTSQWKVHGQALQTYGYILYDQFIVLIADDSLQPSGCSIDSSVQFIKELESKYSLNLLSNDLIFYIKDQKINHIQFQKIKEAITPNTWVINPHFKNFEDFQSNLIQKAENSMYRRLL